MIYLKTSIGIEIREDDLLITCLKSNFSGGVFTHFKRIKGYRTRDKGDVVREIDQYFKGNRLGRENIVLGIPRKDAIIRHLDLPREVEDNLKQVVLYQVQSFEPSDEEKHYYDYVRVDSKQPGKRLTLLLVMIKKSILDLHLETLLELGIRPVAVSVGSIALATLFLQGADVERDKVFVLGDLKSKGIEILALRNGSLVYTREAPREEGATWKDLLLRELELAAAKIRLGPEDAIEKIVLAGEESEAAQREVREEMNECELMGSHLQFEMPLQNRAHLQEAAAALGLAYSRIIRRPPISVNLLPAELRVRQTRWAYVPSIILGVIIMVLLGGLAFRQMIQEQILERQLDQEVDALKMRVARVHAVRSQAEALEKKIKYFEDLFGQRDMNLEVLQELTTILPTDTFLNLYQNREGTIQITGSSSSYTDLIPKLERSPLLKNIQPRGTVFKDDQTGKDRFTFEVKLER